MWFLGRRKKVNIVDSGWLQGMTDIHCHLVPAVDDGSRSLEETRRLISSMHDAGIQRIITTPHIYTRYHNNDSDSLSVAHQALLPQIQDIGVELRLAAEYMMDEAFEHHLSKPLLMLGNSHYLLVETSFAGAPIYLYQMLQRVIAAGAIPLLAHPERYLYMKLSEYDRLRSAGCAFQLNLFSLTGMYGVEVEKRANTLLEQGIYSFVGTDTHRIDAWQRTIASAETNTKYESLIRPLIEANNSLI